MLVFRTRKEGQREEFEWERGLTGSYPGTEKRAGSETRGLTDSETLLQ